MLNRVGIAACAALALMPAAANAKTDSIEQLGKALAIAEPIFAGGVSIWRNDWTGLAEMTVTTGATVGTAYGLKYVVHEERPDHSDNKSFPSDTSALAFAPSTLKLARAALLEQQLTLPFRAPRSMFNVRIGGARRVAAQSYSLERIKAVKSATGATINDVVLAMSAGALRAYLIDQNALPDAPLTAMVPVNLRKDDDDRGGNNVGTFLCNLATDLDDPAKRLETISASIRETKEVFWQLPPVQQLALSAFNIGGLFFGLIPGYLSAGSPPFNIVISMVP